MTNPRSIPTNESTPEHLADKYRVFMIRFDDQGILFLHVRHVVTFAQFCKYYILDNMELIEESSSGQKKIFKTSNIIAIEKVLNSNKPNFEISKDGFLYEVN